LITTVGRLGKVVLASLLLAPAVLANAEPSTAPAVAVSAPVTSNPLALGAPPAWGLLLLGASVIGVTVLRRMRKTVPQRARR